MRIFKIFLMGKSERIRILHYNWMIEENAIENITNKLNKKKCNKIVL